MPASTHAQSFSALARKRSEVGDDHALSYNRIHPRAAKSHNTLSTLSGAAPTSCAISSRSGRA